MHIKPKEIFVNLPIALTFENADGILAFVSNINTIIHGKVKVKCEELGSLGGKHVGIFYIQRNGEYQELRNSFMELIENEEMEQPHLFKDLKPLEEYSDNDLFRHLESAADDPSGGSSF
jgi:hypothetical protein